MPSIKYRFDIVRKSDGKQTHSVMGDKQGATQLFNLGDAYTDQPHPAWGDPSSYDIVETNVSINIDYRGKRDALLSALDEYKAEILLAILESLDGNQGKLNAFLPKFRQIRDDNPLPPKP